MQGGYNFVEENWNNIFFLIFLQVNKEVEYKKELRKDQKYLVYMATVEEWASLTN